MVSSNSLASSIKAKKDKVKDLNGATMKRRRNVSSYTSDTADIADQAWTNIRSIAALDFVAEAVTILVDTDV